MNKTVSLCKKIFKIELVLLYIAIISLIFSFYFKSKTTAEFFDFDVKLNLFLTEYAQDGFVDSSFSQLKNLYEPYAYFDSEIQNLLEQTESLILSGGEAKTVAENLNALQSLVYKTRQRLNIGYDSIIIISFLLIFFVVFILLYKWFVFQNEEKSKIKIKEEQDKLHRDLHDGIAQDLAAVKIFLEKNEVEKSKIYANQAFNEVRYILNSTNDDFEESLILENFEQLLQKNLNIFEANFGIKTELLVGVENFSFLSSKAKINLWRIFQESLSNIARHSNAAKITVKILPVLSDFKFLIIDDGMGIKDSQTKSENEKVAHYGLENIKTRAKEIGAKVEFIQNEQGGCTVAITIKNIIR